MNEQPVAIPLNELYDFESISKFLAVVSVILLAVIVGGAIRNMIINRRSKR